MPNDPETTENDDVEGHVPFFFNDNESVVANHDEVDGLDDETPA